MPIYAYKCSKCNSGFERVQGLGETVSSCPECGGVAINLPTFPAMVKMKGEGGYPSRRKFVKGTAPYTNSKAWLDSEPSSL